MTSNLLRNIYCYYSYVLAQIPFHIPLETFYLCVIHQKVDNMACMHTYT